MNSLFNGGGWKPEDEDCSRVLTTSRGHVTIAPAVPATLYKVQGKSTVTEDFVNARYLFVIACAGANFSTEVARTHERSELF